MLTIVIKSKSEEYFDDKKQEFITKNSEEKTIQLEHSLLSLSKWESKWKKAFLGKTPKTNEENLDYIKCMTLTQNVPDELYSNLSVDNIKEINAYIESPMTATTFQEDKNQPKSNEIITAEIIYYWMIQQNIPMECQKWHLNRLLTLIRVCSIKNNPNKKKMSMRETMRRNTALNELQKAKYHSHG